MAICGDSHARLHTLERAPANPSASCANSFRGFAISQQSCTQINIVTFALREGGGGAALAGWLGGVCEAARFLYVSEIPNAANAAAERDASSSHTHATPRCVFSVQTK